MSVASVKTYGLLGHAKLSLENGARNSCVITFIFLAFVLAAALSVSAQEKCLQPGNLALIRKQITAGEKPEENLKLRDELLCRMAANQPGRPHHPHCGYDAR